MIAFTALPHQRLDGVSVELGGAVVPLSGRRQLVSTPFSWQDEVLVSVSSATSRKLIVSWRGK